jgi:hypothetical protein
MVRPAMGVPGIDGANVPYNSAAVEFKPAFVLAVVTAVRHAEVS